LVLLPPDTRSPSGVGKTTLAGPLAAALGYAPLTKDTIK
jgi:predicted kinase